MVLFGQTTTPTPSPAVTYVRVQPLEMKAAEWSLQAIVIYVILRDFFMYFVPWVGGVMARCIHSSFPKAEALITEELDEAVESVAESAGAAIARAATGTLAHVEEELAEAAVKGGAGIVDRLLEELTS